MNEDIIIVVRSKGQIVIPAALREKLGIKMGTRIAIHSEESKLILQPINDEFIRSLRGCGKGKDSIAKAREREHKREDRARDRKLQARYR
jgi:AbrB family looped-hinge helix DNA binding protein